MWLEPEIVSGAAAILIRFAWLLSIPTWGLCGEASLMPTSMYEL
jgi:hypothetical protein